jgi:cytochrome c-type biogenesis protein
MSSKRYENPAVVRVMETYQLTVIPLAFGLLGFVEPCSIGANIIFLGYLQMRERNRMAEAVKFTVTRALFLGFIGLTAGALGQPLRAGTFSYSLLLGVFYVVIGLFALWWGYRGAGMRSLDVGRYLPKDGAVPLGVIFGLSAPACSMPLLLALMGLGALKGAWVGFLSLFIFGLALSAPLLWIARSERAEEKLRRLGGAAMRAPYLPGAVLILVGAVSIWLAWRQLAAT